MRSRIVKYTAVVVICCLAIFIAMWSSHFKSSSGEIMLHEYECHNYQKIRQMIESGISPYTSVAPPHDIDLIMVACNRGDLDFVKFLKGVGVNLNYTNATGRNPLMEAACSGSLGVVDFLIEEGNTPSLVDSYGGTALMVAVGSRRTNALEIVKR